MWKYKIMEVVSYMPKANDRIGFKVEFFSDTESWNKEYLIYLQEKPDFDLTALKALIEVDINYLNKIDDFKETFSSILNKEI